LQTEEHVVRKKFLVVLWCTVYTGITTVEKQIPSNCSSVASPKFGGQNI